MNKNHTINNKEGMNRKLGTAETAPKLMIVILIKTTN